MVRHSEGKKIKDKMKYQLKKMAEDQIEFGKAMENAEKLKSALHSLRNEMSELTRRNEQLPAIEVIVPQQPTNDNLHNALPKDWYTSAPVFIPEHCKVGPKFSLNGPIYSPGSFSDQEEYVNMQPGFSRISKEVPYHNTNINTSGTEMPIQQWRNGEMEKSSCSHLLVPYQGSATTYNNNPVQSQQVYDYTPSSTNPFGTYVYQQDPVDQEPYHNTGTESFSPIQNDAFLYLQEGFNCSTSEPYPAFKQT